MEILIQMLMLCGIGLAIVLSPMWIGILARIIGVVSAVIVGSVSWLFRKLFARKAS